MGKPQQNQELNHWSHRQESQVHRPFFWSSFSSEDLGSPHLKKEDRDTNVLNWFNVINRYFSIIPILTLNRSRRTAWVENPVHMSNEMVDSSDISAATSVVTPTERKSPIREFLFMQKKILSMIVIMSPMSLMEPWGPKEFLDRRLEPLRPSGLWINISYRFVFYLILSVTMSLMEHWEPEEFLERRSDPSRLPCLWIIMNETIISIWFYGRFWSCKEWKIRMEF